MDLACALDFSPTMVIYHANCPDGFGAAWVLHQRFGEAATYLPAVHAEAPPDEVVAGQRIVMVDVSFPRAEVERIARLADRFVLVDHHVSAQRALQDLPYTYFDNARSGAGLAWDMCFPDAPRPLLINIIEDRDLWRHALPQTRLLSVLDSLPFDFFAWSEFSLQLETPEGLSRVDREAVAIDRAFQIMMDRVEVHARRIVQQGKRGWAVNAPHDMASFLCARLYARPDTDFAMSWFLTEGNIASCSWRCSKASDMDVVELAKPFGGSGHRCAAGARMSLAQLRQLIGAD